MPGGLAHAVTARPLSKAEAAPESGRPDRLPADARSASSARPESLAPLLLGAMVGALIAGRLETAAGCVFVAGLASWAAGAGWPSAAWLRMLASGAALAIALHGLKALWPGERAADELAALVAPLERIGVPVRRMRAVLSLALRFAPLVADELKRVARVQALRAGRPPRGAAEWIQRQRAAVVPAMIGSLERAERVALALEARHYRLRPVFRGPRSPWIASGAGLALVAAALVWRK